MRARRRPLGRLREPALIGYAHFLHLTPRPAGYVYPYPDFYHVVYVAQAEAYMPEAKLDDGYELGSTFTSIEEARALPLGAGERIFLEAAMKKPPSP